MQSELSSTDARMYKRSDSVVFLKTNEVFGGLSNMAAGYPLLIGGVNIRTSEALYQACRFPHLPDVQARIIAQASPMSAKMVGKPFRAQTRADWDGVRVRIMQWCLRVKLAQNCLKFGQLLLSTGDRPIVEESRRDAFWGAVPLDSETLSGNNVLGCLLMDLRDVLRGSDSDGLIVVDPPNVSDFLLLGKEIGAICAPDVAGKPPGSDPPPTLKTVQTGMFEK